MWGGGGKVYLSLTRVDTTELFVLHLVQCLGLKEEDAFVLRFLTQALSRYVGLFHN